VVKLRVNVSLKSYIVLICSVYDFVAVVTSDDGASQASHFP
jgi:hypothetical protein